MNPDSSFINPQIEQDGLPAVADITYHPVERNYLKVRILTSFIIGFLLLALYVVFIFTQPEDTPSWFVPSAGILLALLIVLLLVSSYKGYYRMGYALRQKDIVFKKGWLWKSNTMIPFKRVQHSEVNQNPIERFFGLAKLKVFTAGGTASDLSIAGLTPQKAEQLKVFITTQTNRNDEEE
jgi:membrane protein YdbS with pleckstrin-like domain